MNNKTVILTILDGWGIGNSCPANAISAAVTPTYNSLIENYPHSQIFADGEHVGLPEGQMGNSEVGHLNLGAGRVVYQDLTKINKSIREGDFFNNPEFLAAIKHAKDNNSSLHFMGLMSSGGVHSSMNHISALIDLVAKHNIKKAYVHAFLDGRDTPPKSAIEFVSQIDEKLKFHGLPEVATVSGRFYAMDRDNRWDRVEKAYNCLIMGEGNKAAAAEEAIENSYNNDITDEFVLPTVIGDDNAAQESRIKDNDAVIFFNYRPDRAREITRSIIDPNFTGFERKIVPNNLYYVCMTKYDDTFNKPIAYPPQSLSRILAEVLDENGVKEFRTAETEKYAHITFFFNGGVEKPYGTETRALIDSPKVATYDLQPEMSADKVTDEVVNALKSKQYQFILVNYANPDMVGHTGNMEAAIKAIDTVDNSLKRIVDAVKEVDAVMLVTADHGNAECMQDPITLKPFTAHTTNPVPFIVVNDKAAKKVREGGALCDVAPTILDILDIEKPSEMTGISLIVK